MEIIEVCHNCWWNDVCKKTNLACQILQGVDMRWDESPNNKTQKMGGENGD